MEMLFSTISAIRNSALSLSILAIITAECRNPYGHSKGYKKSRRGLKGGN